jgi:hypothetical protein
LLGKLVRNVQEIVDTPLKKMKNTTKIMGITVAIAVIVRREYPIRWKKCRLEEFEPDFVIIFELG